MNRNEAQSLSTEKLDKANKDYNNSRRTRTKAAKILKIIHDLPDGIRYLGRPQTFNIEFMSVFMSALADDKT